VSLTLGDDRVARFARQLLVPSFGEEAQLRLQSARVRAVGVDAVASAALVYLVQAGVGRLWLDDGAPVSPADLAGWIFPPPSVGTQRTAAAAAALAALSRFTAVEPYPSGGVPSAALVFARPVAQALSAAEAARRAGIPHVVAEPDADGGCVITVPPGAPCYACARSTSGTPRPPLAGVAALSALAASELVQLVSLPGSVSGRRLELARGVVRETVTSRRAGCACASGPGSRPGQ
jgi:adenylyltransferase/sulfurtransferase